MATPWADNPDKLRLTAAQAAKRIEGGEVLEYVLDWSAGWYSGTDRVGPFRKAVPAAHIAHLTKNARYDRRGQVQHAYWRIVTD